jgi:2-haloacid dehalogenase
VTTPETGRPVRPLAAAVDVVETMLSLDEVRARVAALTDEPGLTERWFARLLRDAFALTCAATYRPFADVAAATLAQLAPELPSAVVDKLVDAFADLRAHPDAAPALTELREAGVRVVALTNSGAASAQQALRRNGLEGSLERIISIDEVERWKPDPAPYWYTARVLDVPINRLAMMSVHAWDTHGAAAAGCVTGWCSRLEGRTSSIWRHADVVGADLVEVAHGLLALPRP